MFYSSIVLNLFSKRILFLLALVIVSLAGFFLWGVLLPGWQASGGDFANYYTASRLVLEGVPLEEAYRDFGWFQQHMDRYGIQQQVGGFIPHPPSTALVLLPFAFFDAVTARRLWTIVNLLLAMVSIVLLSRTSGLHWLDSALIFLGSGYGLWNNFRFGQLYLLLLVSILVTLYLWRTGRPVLAGICLGALIPVKYVGLPFLLYFAWRRQWNLCLACVATILLVLGISLWLMDLQTFRVFLVEVLPRHLQGEIQDPYAVAFQTWSSLFRRLFLYEPLLNPSPVHFSPLLFLVFKNTSFWIILGTGLLALLRVRFDDEESRFRFQIGWILLLLLLVSPVSASYHFLLLTISTAFLVQILLSRRQTGGAVLVILCFVVLNLPHYTKITRLASQWGNLVAYPRLWVLLSFCLIVLYLFRNFLIIPKASLVRAAVVSLLLAGIQTSVSYSRWVHEPVDGAERVTIDDPAYRRHLGLILHSPDRGLRRIVFSYCQLFANRYSIFALPGNPWTKESPGNLYYPDLRADDTSLLAQTIRLGESQIWLIHGSDREWRFVVSGRTPAWHPEEQVFAFEREGRLLLYQFESDREILLPLEYESFDPVFSADGKGLLYCVRTAAGEGLQMIDLDSYRIETLLNPGPPLRSPAVSPDGRFVAFSSMRAGNWDIWVLDMIRRTQIRVTSSGALDRDPVWDSVASRLFFLSDRGRGLGCTTLYSIPFSEDLP